MTKKRLTDEQLRSRLQREDPSGLAEGQDRASHLPTSAQLRAASDQLYPAPGRSGAMWWKAAVLTVCLTVVVGAWAATSSLWPQSQVGVDSAGTATTGDASGTFSPIEPTKTTVELGETVVNVASLGASGSGYVKFSQRNVGKGTASSNSRDRYWPVQGGEVYSVHQEVPPGAVTDKSTRPGAGEMAYLMVQSGDQALGTHAVVLRRITSSMNVSDVTPQQVSVLAANFVKETTGQGQAISFERTLDELLTFGLAEAAQRAIWLKLLATSANVEVADSQLNDKPVVAITYKVSGVKDETSTNTTFIDVETGIVVARRHQGSVDTGFGANSDITVSGVPSLPADVLDAYTTAKREGQCSSEAGFPVCQLFGMKNT